MMIMAGALCTNSCKWGEMGRKKAHTLLNCTKTKGSSCAPFWHRFAKIFSKTM